MGLLSGGNSQMPINKEIEIDTKAETNALVAALQQAGLKVKVRGDSMNVRNKMFAAAKCTGTILNADGEWTGSIMLTGPSKAVINTYAAMSACLKKFTK